MADYDLVVAGGTVVTVTGAGFTSDAEVTVGGVPASSVTYRSPTSLRVVVPVYWRCIPTSRIGLEGLDPSPEPPHEATRTVSGTKSSAIFPADDACARHPSFPSCSQTACLMIFPLVSNNA